jgi:cytochrome c-type biogenesis protein CcmF
MEFIGERLLVGQIGHFFVILSFVAALLSSFSFFKATQERAGDGFASWLKIGRYSFGLHSISTLGIILSLFFILVNKYYEYEYAWANVSDDLPFEYTFSAFWKEQQGSFLLWSFWHSVLGLIIMWRGGKWEAPVLSVIALAEAFIGSMLLGLYFGDYHVGASPFELLRNTMAAPIFQDPNYLSQITGNGLNPLLQNYWMTIHPPTLFLGFASTVVPFAFAIAGLWTGEHKEWLKPALKWSLFSGAILGTGILMGGAWAYEALSFGGYWAWDPVENSSLVPWIILVAGIHSNLIARATSYSIRATYGFYLATFILILYSTYLTRSGILGDSSAHAFTAMGLDFQLLLFIFGFTGLALFLYIKNRKAIPAKQQEERMYSREFWMFIGSLVLLFSGVLITGATSLPVWNKVVQLFNPDYVGAALKDPVAHHNRYQLWIAVFIGILTGIAQFMRYSERNWNTRMRTFLVHMGIASVGAVILTILNLQWLEANAWQYVALLFAGMFAVVSNADYLISVLKGNLKMAASALSHIGFGILVLGVMGSGLNKQWLSSNPFAMEGLIEGADAEAMSKNVLLLRDAPMPILGGLEATYQSDTVERQTRTFKVLFKGRNKNGEYTGETFELEPNVMYNRQFSEIVASNPSTKHYWNRDIFTHVTSLPKAELDPEYAKQQEDSTKYVRYEAAIGDTIFTPAHYIVLERLSKNPSHKEYIAKQGDLGFGLEMKAYALGDSEGFPLSPVMYIRPGEGGFTLPHESPMLQLKARLNEESMEKIFQVENELVYNEFKIKQGDSFRFNGYDILFAQVEREVKNPNYIAEEGDMAIAAILEIRKDGNLMGTSQPVYLIRGSNPFSLKDELASEGLHFQFTNIDPQTAIFTLNVAYADENQRLIPIEIAEDAPRSDYIVLEAILFPGINLVWLGSIMMMIGLAFGLWNRWRD